MKKKPYDQKALMEFAFRMSGDIAATIAIPVSILVFLVKRFESSSGERRPALVGLAILVSFLISTVSVSRKAIRYGEQYVDMTDEADEEDRAGPDTTPPSGRDFPAS